MAKVDWNSYLIWREGKGLNNADVAIFVGSEPTTVSDSAIDVDGTNVVVVRFGESPIFMVPESMIED